ncbi:MAG: DUF4160 domain-containing protein [Pseudomonadota bacterium]
MVERGWATGRESIVAASLRRYLESQQEALTEPFIREDVAPGPARQWLKAPAGWLSLMPEIMQGSLPRRAAKLVKEWCLDHQGELLEDWRLAQALMPLKRIPGAVTLTPRAHVPRTRDLIAALMACSRYRLTLPA